MIRGTTPTHIFALPFDVSNVAECMVIYAQDDTEVLHKKTDACSMSGNELRVELTQEETLLFDCSKNVQIQLRVLTTEGKALATKPAIYPVHKCLNSEVLGDEN